ncbi:hypothetical protein GOBAR_AA33520 [Gossypium barbadense]|uniref:Uncharacterized protein n=1 Tax=Gossypium barbadense TaxID=3634 RepID=A0A2P5W7X8_GOSBA|nr:hypothetical protein GOBAR_AA33520 [Gossypium barbadense]
MSETRFQNTETALKNQQASIQGLETQIGQLAKLISEQPQGSLPSNTKSNPREKLNVIAIRDEERLVAKPRPEPVVSECENEVGQNERKSLSTEYKPRVPYPNVTRKDRSDEQFGDETITLQARNPSNASKIEGDCTNCSTKIDHTVQPILQEISSKDKYEPCSFHNKGSTHEERRLQIEELDEWLTFKPRKHDKPKLRQNKLNVSPNKHKVGDKVSLDATNPHIDTAKPNEEIPLTVLSIFPFGIVEVSHPKFGTFKVNNTCLKPYFDDIHSRNEEYKLLEPP